MPNEKKIDLSVFDEDNSSKPKIDLSVFDEVGKKNGGSDSQLPAKQPTSLLDALGSNQNTTEQSPTQNIIEAVSGKKQLPTEPPLTQEQIDKGNANLAANPIQNTPVTQAEQQNPNLVEGINQAVDVKKARQVAMDEYKKVQANPKTKDLQNTLIQKGRTLDAINSDPKVKQISDLYQKMTEAMSNGKQDEATFIKSQIDNLESQPLKVGASENPNEPSAYVDGQAQTTPAMVAQDKAKLADLPENATYGDLIKKLHAESSQYNNAHKEYSAIVAAAEDAKKQAQVAAQFTPDEDGVKTKEGLLTGFGLGLKNTIDNIASGILRATGNSDRADELMERNRMNSILYPEETKGYAASAGEMLGSVAPYVAGSVVAPESLFAQAALGGSMMGLAAKGESYDNAYNEAIANGLSTDEAKAKASHDSNVSAVTQGAVGAVMPFNDAIAPIFKAGEMGVVKKALVDAGLNLSEFGISGAIEDAANGKDVWKGAGDRLEQGAALMAMMHLIHTGAKIPAIAKDIVETSIARRLPDVKAQVGDMVISGQMTPEQAATFLKPYEDKAEILSKMPDNLPTSKEQQIYPLLQEKMSLLEQKKKLDSSFHPAIDEKIKGNEETGKKGIDGEIQDILAGRGNEETKAERNARIANDLKTDSIKQSDLIHYGENQKAIDDILGQINQEENELKQTIQPADVGGNGGTETSVAETANSEGLSTSEGDNDISDSVSENPQVESFETSKGSTYQVADGKTTRNKSVHPEHPGDEGLKEQSNKTVYVSPENADILSEVSTSGDKKVIAEKNGKIGVMYTDGPNKGKFEKRTLVDYETKPKEGTHPIEFFDDGYHIGNRITKIKTKEDAISQQKSGALPIQPEAENSGGISGGNEGGQTPEQGQETDSETKRQVPTQEQIKLANEDLQSQLNFDGGNDLRGDKKEPWMHQATERELSQSKDTGPRSGQFFPKKIRAIKFAIDGGKYQKAILEGRMTNSDAVSIIESAGLEVPKDIRDLADMELKAADDHFNSLPESEQEQILQKHEAESKGAMGTDTPASEGTPVQPTQGSETTDTQEQQPSKESGINSEGKPQVNTTPETETGDVKTTGISHEAMQGASERHGVESPERGVGHTTEQLIEKGRKLISDGADPTKVVEDFNKDGKIGVDEISTVRAEAERLDREANAAHDKFGKDSQEYKDAQKKFADFQKSIKPMLTVWGEIGRGVQGETDIDTGTFRGVQRAYDNLNPDKPMSAKQEKEAQEKVAAVQRENQILKDKIAQIQANIDNHTAEMPSKRGKSKGKDKIAEGLHELASILGGVKNLDSSEKNATITSAVRKIAEGLIEEGETSIDKVWDKVKHYVKEKYNKELPAIYQSDAESAAKYLINSKNKKVKEKVKYLNERFAEKKDNKFTPEDVKDIWGYAKENYIDKGKEWNDSINGTAMDLGLTPEQVIHAISLPKGNRTISTEMYLRTAERNKAVKAAKDWVENTTDSKVAKFIRAVGKFPATLFKLKVFGHGTVAPITHAGMDAFDAGNWKRYFTFMKDTYKSAWSLSEKGKAEFERRKANFKKEPMYGLALRSGLDIDPDKSYDEYDKPNPLANKFLQKGGKIINEIGKIGDRGFFELKPYRLAKFEHEYNKLSDIEKADPNSVKYIAQLINHQTGTHEINIPGAGTAFFAPKLEASRWAGLIVDPAKAAKTFIQMAIEPKQVTPADKAAAKVVVKRAARIMATYAGAIAANAGLQAAAGYSNNPVNWNDPSKSDFLKFKAGNKTIDPAGGVVSAAHFMQKLVSIPFMDKKDLGRDSRFDKESSTITKYLRNKLSPFAGPLVDLATHSTASGNVLPPFSDKPVPWGHKMSWQEYIGSEFLPIPIAEAVNTYEQTLHEEGMNKSQVNNIMNAVFTGLFTGNTGAHMYENTGGGNSDKLNKETRTELQMKNAGKSDAEIGKATERIRTKAAIESAKRSVSGEIRALRDKALKEKGYDKTQEYKDAMDKLIKKKTEAVKNAAN